MEIKPSKIRLDAATICQLKCPTCSTTEGITAKALGARTLKFDDFKRFVDANPWIRHVELSSRGEIFLNRDLLAIIKYAYDRGIVLSAANGSNFNTVSDEILESLVKYQFNMITCSIDGATSETYKIYRRGGDFDQVIANIKKVNEFKAKYRSVFPRLRWQFIPFGHNEHEILQAKQKALELNMEFFVKMAWGDFSPVKNSNLIKMVSGSQAATRNEYQKEYGKVYLADKICSQMWLQPQINTDGRVLGCCKNHWGDYGNAFRDDFVGILNGEKMNYARAMLLGKKPEREDIPCTQCAFYRDMKRNKFSVFSENVGHEENQS